MVYKSHICVLGMILCSLHTGTSGLEDTHEFYIYGENLTLPCNNAPPDCTSTTWIYSRVKHSVAVKLFTRGIKNNETDQHESLGSDCSLSIYKVRNEDYGLYSCRQHVKEEKQSSTDARVFLHLLHVSPSSTQTEIRPGSSVTLSCRLYSYDQCPFDEFLHTEGFQLVWVDQTGVNLQTDHRYQISSSSNCNSTMTTTLLNEDKDREWRCQIIKGTEVKASASYTVKYLDSLSELLYKVIPAVSAAVVVPLLAALIFYVICKKRSDKGKRAQDQQESDKSAHPAVCEMDVNSGRDEIVKHTKSDEDYVAYVEVIASRKALTERHNVSNEKVTYAVIRGAKSGAQNDCSAIYAFVNPPK